jgi:hypothetical protein
MYYITLEASLKLIVGLINEHGWDFRKKQSGGGGGFSKY